MRGNRFKGIGAILCAALGLALYPATAGGE